MCTIDFKNIYAQHTFRIYESFKLLKCPFQGIYMNVVDSFVLTVCKLHLLFFTVKYKFLTTKLNILFIQI